MVLSIARQSVIIKCRMQRSVLTGNYEYYYAAGLLSQLCGFTLPEDILPAELAALLGAKEKELVTGDEKEAWLKKLLLEYEPQEDYDEQMRELLVWGQQEKRLWIVH